jgi:hypothetical protein
LPVASCEDGAEATTLSFDDGELELAAEGTELRVAGETFASCTELCAARSGGRTVTRCEQPTRMTRYTDSASERWQLTCAVEGQQCHLPTILTPPGHGRRPEGYVDADSTCGTSIGAWLARVGHLEAASVPAFERLARELSLHGAPRHLVSRARRSMRDEVIHARMVSALARRHGSKVRPARIPRLPERRLEAIAIENAVEGCVHETLGAIVAVHQAQAAQDPKLRAAFVRIARDETRHAELAWDVHRWSLAWLDADAKERVNDALKTAAARLDAAAIAARTEAQARELGLPRLDAAERMIGAARALVWRDETSDRRS